MAKLSNNTAIMDSDKGLTLATAGTYIPHDVIVKPNSSFILSGSIITGIINNQNISLTNNSGNTITLTNSGIIETDELTVSGKTVSIGTTTVTNANGALIESTIGNISGGNLSITRSSENTNCTTAGANVSGISISFNATAARATGSVNIGSGWVSTATTKYLNQDTINADTLTRYITAVKLTDGKYLEAETIKDSTNTAGNGYIKVNANKALSIQGPETLTDTQTAPELSIKNSKIIVTEDTYTTITGNRIETGISISNGIWFVKDSTIVVSMTYNNEYINLRGKILDGIIWDTGVLNLGATYDSSYNITGLDSSHKGGNEGNILIGNNTGKVSIYSNTGTILNTTNDNIVEIGSNNKTVTINNNVKVLNVTNNSGSIAVANNSGSINTSEFNINTLQDEDNNKFLVLSVG